MATGLIDVVALDVGDRRIGVARAGLEARLPQPLPVIDRQLLTSINAIAEHLQTYDAQEYIIGIPVSLSGKDSDQTLKAKQFAKS